MKFVDVFHYWLISKNDNRFQAMCAVLLSFLKVIHIFIGAKNVKGKGCE